MSIKKTLILTIVFFILFALPAFGIECTSDSHCPADQFCYNYECHLPECQIDSDCQPGYFCYLKMCYLEDTCFGAECRPNCSDQPAVCSQAAPNEDCQCRSVPFCRCQDYCTRLYCGNEVCTQWETSCRSEWFCQSQTPRSSCDCWNLNSDHPDPLRVQKGEKLNFTSEAAVDPPASPNIYINFALYHQNQKIDQSGNLLAGFVRSETIGGIPKDIYQASWSWSVPNTDQAKGDYHLTVSFSCDQRSSGKLPPLPSSPTQPFGLTSLIEKALVFLGLRPAPKTEYQPQSTPTPTPRFAPPFPTIIRPESGSTLKLGTFQPPLPASSCYDFYFRVID